MNLKMFFLCFFLVIFSVTETNNLSNRLENYSVELSKESLYKKIVMTKINFPEIVFAQAVLESAHFESEVFKCKNNLFGMKQPRVRTTLSIHNSNIGYASYMTWIQSVEDYKLWQLSMMKNRSFESRAEYFDLLSRVYAEDKNYVSKLKSVISQHSDLLNSKF